MTAENAAVRLNRASVASTAVAAALIAVCAAAQSSTPTPVPPGGSRGFSALDFLKASMTSNISVQGRVVDPSGKLLEDVNLSIRSFSFDVHARELIQEAKSAKRVDGSFSASCWSCGSIELFFWKDGYFDETLEFGIERGLSGEPPKPVRAYDIVVVLKPAGRAANLMKREGDLVIIAPDTIKIATFDQGASYGSIGVTLSGGEARRTRPPRYGPVSPQYDPRVTAPFIGLGTRAGLGGAVEAVELLDQRNRPTGRFAPAGLYLWASGRDDGFAVYEPSAAARARPGFRFVSREMREAPETGYVNPLPLPTENTYTFFYFRLGKLFGKGYLVGPGFSSPKERKEAGANVTLFANPDGSRNVQGEVS